MVVLADHKMMEDQSIALAAEGLHSNHIIQEITGQKKPCELESPYGPNISKESTHALRNCIHDMAALRQR
jgi:hypothetical protein